MNQNNATPGEQTGEPSRVTARTCAHCTTKPAKAHRLIDGGSMWLAAVQYAIAAEQAGARSARPVYYEALWNRWQGQSGGGGNGGPINASTVRISATISIGFATCNSAANTAQTGANRRRVSRNEQHGELRAHPSRQCHQLFPGDRWHQVIVSSKSTRSRVQYGQSFFG